MIVVKRRLKEIGIAERKNREKAEMRNEILKAAREIITNEGAENLSIRKIAGIIEYSPAIIYHYFDNKEAIIEKLITEDYEKILKALTSSQQSEESAVEKLGRSIKRYVTLATEMGYTYKNMMLNNSPAFLAHTAVLHRGASTERPALAMLCQTLREVPGWAERDEIDIETTAQIIWAAIFGLTLRLIVEKVGEEQKQRLTDQLIKLIFRSLENIPSGA